MGSARLYIYVILEVNRGCRLASVAGDVEGRKCAIHFQECVYKHTSICHFWAGIRNDASNLAWPYLAIGILVNVRVVRRNELRKTYMNHGGWR